jgi:hypothetical protein
MIAKLLGTCVGSTKRERERKRRPPRSSQMKPEPDSKNMIVDPGHATALLASHSASEESFWRQSKD